MNICDTKKIMISHYNFFKFIEEQYHTEKSLIIDQSFRNDKTLINNLKQLSKIYCDKYPIYFTLNESGFLKESIKMKRVIKFIYTYKSVILLNNLKNGFQKIFK